MGKRFKGPGFDPDWERLNQDFRVIGEKVLRDRTDEAARDLIKQFTPLITRLASAVPRADRDAVVNRLASELIEVLPKALAASSPRGYATTALRNRVFTELRRAKRRRSRESALPPDWDVSDPLAHHLLEDAAFHTASVERCLAAIDRLHRDAQDRGSYLDARVAEVVEFRYHTNVPISQACIALGFDPQTYKAIGPKISKARNNPKSLLYRVAEELVEGSLQTHLRNTTNKGENK